MRVHQFIEHWARLRPHAEFVVQDDLRLSYGDANSTVDRLASRIVAEGVQQFERIGVLARNRPEYVLLYLAASKAGVVIVPIDARQPSAQWQHVLVDSGVRLLFCADEFVSSVDEFRKEITTLRGFINFDGPANGWRPFDDWLTEKTAEMAERDMADANPYYQIYTSGTTGQPKGVVLSHGAIVAHVMQNDLLIRGKPGEHWLMATPIFHTSAINDLVLQVAYTGGTLFILPAFEPNAVLQAIQGNRIAITVLASAMISACLSASSDVGNRSFNSLRFIAYGGSAISKDTLRRATDVFGCDLAQIYGLTECPSVAFLTPEDHNLALSTKSELLESAGRPELGTDVRILDDDGRAVPGGTLGEVAVRGPQVMSEYWTQPEATKEALRDGWLHTGDVGFLDQEGYLFIQDRIKDVIVTSGRNVFPRMIEDVLSQHPLVHEVAVIGVPNVDTGEAIKAVVVPTGDAQPDEQELINFCDGALADYQRPSSVDIIDSLPRNTMGKILKRVLREPYWSGQQRRVGET